MVQVLVELDAEREYDKFAPINASLECFVAIYYGRFRVAKDHVINNRVITGSVI